MSLTFDAGTLSHAQPRFLDFPPVCRVAAGRASCKAVTSWRPAGMGQIELSDQQIPDGAISPNADVASTTYRNDRRRLVQGVFLIRSDALLKLLDCRAHA
jgi:hypothetical protein